jgi:uncharacterized protein (TIGR03083 family)
VIVERPVDCGQIYGAQRRALIELVASATDDELATVVPATPAWTVQEVIAHVVGITADLNALCLGDGDPDEWTAAQVASRRGETLGQLVAEWDHEAPRFEEGLRLLGYQTGSHFVGDLLQHAQDVRSALGRSRLDDTEAIAVGLDHYLDTLHQALTAAGAGSIAVTVGEEGWVLGAGPQVTTLTTDTFELFRALGGRRSAAQIGSMAWSTPPDAVLDLLSPYPLPTTDLTDP